MKKIFLACVLVLIASQSVSANTNYNLCFNSLDADGNGVMTKGEFLVAFPNGDLTTFEEADMNADNTVDHEEWEAYKTKKGFE
ncbi:hypothetical protein [uncultured Pseudodesulfovibrio sp.]|uniref:hypothetical protein n=1 Tax=uncultured Pseudodesulfovibrio sp. TaxID=2035858 RepID=UPI0029C703FC|nr:hypothetical protein [uncultured Pseudodesulfovibrio sp.]